MNLFKNAALAAGATLALALTLSCSSDDSDNGSGGFNFNEKSQIFREDSSAYTSNGTIKMRFFDNDSGYLCDDIVVAGSVTNGMVNLKSPLPTPPAGCLKTLQQPEGFICSSFPSGAKTTDAQFLLYDGDELLGILSMLYSEYNKSYASLLEEIIKYSYIQEKATMTCDAEITWQEYTVVVDLNINAKSGWNKIYEISNSLSNNAFKQSNTNNILTNELKWTLSDF
ncbi:MAG: hypothetical protein FWC26_08455 [Fibromonadales bacterium]|nr:hypothetical protein [Fibromonadales bacterium]